MVQARWLGAGAAQLKVSFSFRAGLSVVDRKGRQRGTTEPFLQPLKQSPHLLGPDGAVTVIMR